MKSFRILPAAVILILLAAVLVSCRSGREYPDPPRPRYHSSFSLIIAPGPGFAMRLHPSGRYYYRSPQGYMYWRGYDNRFYLDQRYLGRVRYSDYEYREWKQKGRKHRRGNGRW